jgi:hypothetical protein
MFETLSPTGRWLAAAKRFGEAWSGLKSALP